MKYIITFLMLLFLFILPTQVSAATNEALGKTITASSEAGATWNAAKANDGVDTTCWESVAHTFPNTLTLDLGSSMKIVKIVLKEKPTWGNRTLNVDITTSLDGTTYSNLITSTNYSIGSVDILVNRIDARYIKLKVNSNSVSPSSQLAEIEVYTFNPRWNLQSVDAMKYTKDVICSQGSYNSTWIDQWLDKAVEVGATHVAISQPYDNPACGNSLTYTQLWVDRIRAKGLKVWHRHMPMAFEGIYSTTKSNSDYYFDMISSYITSNPTLFDTGDIFTPIPEPQNGGINGVTGCGSVCQFQSQKDFNNWLKTAMLVSELSFKQLGYNPGDVKIGYFGFDGFVVWGECNPDWNGILTDATVSRMGNIAIDHYECGGRSMVTALTDTTKSFRKKYPTTPLYIGEWGTITATNSAQQVTAVTNAYNAFITANVQGVNYWHLGTGASNEALVNADWSVRAAFNTLKSFFLP